MKFDFSPFFVWARTWPMNRALTALYGVGCLLEHIFFFFLFQQQFSSVCIWVPFPPLLFSPVSSTPHRRRRFLMCVANRVFSLAADGARASFRRVAVGGVPKKKRREPSTREGGFFFYFLLFFSSVPPPPPLFAALRPFSRSPQLAPVKQRWRSGRVRLQEGQGGAAKTSVSAEHSHRPDTLSLSYFSPVAQFFFSFRIQSNGCYSFKGF